MRARLLFSLLLAGCATSGPVERVTLLLDADVLTQDAANPIAESFAFAEGQVLQVGTSTELLAAYPDAQRVELDGATVVPGFVDSHAHVRELGMDATKVDLVGVADMDEIVARLKTSPDANRGDWLVGQGWDEGKFAEAGYPDRAALDAAFPDMPIYLESLHGFAAIANGAALERAGIGSTTPDPRGGTILRRDSGEATGLLLTLAQSLVSDLVPEPSALQREEAILSGLLRLREVGVTSVHEAGMTGADVAAFRSLAARDALPIRVYGMLDGNDAALMDAWFSDGPLDDPDDWLDIRSIKVFYDGSLGSRTALLAAPYSDRPDLAKPTERMSPNALQALAVRAAETGFQVAVHAIGDEANRRMLDIFESALGEDAPDARWRSEHAQVLLPGHIARLSRTGTVASMQPSHAVGDSGWAEDRVGPERITRAYAWRTLLDAGVPLAFNSDLPGEPWTPIETLHFAVTRSGLSSDSESWKPEQALTVEESLRAMTQGGAYAAFQEGRIGVIAPGAYADFVVLDRDPTRVPAEGLQNLSVDQVWVAGERKH